MKNKTLCVGALTLLLLPARVASSEPANSPELVKEACSTFAAGKLATADGSVMTGHTCDGNCDFTLKVIPGQKHEPGEKVRMDWPGIPGGFEHTVRGVTEIPEAEETFTYFQIECPIANVHQVFFTENTCATRRELRSLSPGEALLDWTHVEKLALQRARTAREAVEIAGALIEKYGLDGVGESFFVSDPNEAWCLEIPGFTNEWVAQRIPDDHIAPHANRMRIGVVNLDDPETFLASPNLIEHAVEKGFYKPETDGPFNFSKVYSGNESPYNSRREWRILSLLNPSANWDPEATDFPFSVKPEFKVDGQWWIDNVWRDHYEGTPYDKTKGIAAGPFGTPGRQRIEGVRFERSIGTETSAYAWVSQARSWLPDSIGGVFWFGLDVPRSSVFVPFYVGNSETPKSWQIGDYTRFSPESARWYFQVIDTFSWIRYKDINTDVRAVFDPMEERAFALQAGIEKRALELYEIDPLLAQDFLTQYSNDAATKAEEAARELFYLLLAKYADGGPRTTVSEEWQKLLLNK